MQIKWELESKEDDDWKEHGKSATIFEVVHVCAGELTAFAFLVVHISPARHQPH